MAERTLPKRKLVVIEEGTITSMASNDTFKKEFPFLASLATKTANKRGGCGGCGRAAAERTAVFTAAKQALAGMDSDKKRRLKELLNAAQVRITYKNNSGKLMQLTF